MIVMMRIHRPPSSPKMRIVMNPHELDCDDVDASSTILAEDGDVTHFDGG